MSPPMVNEQYIGSRRFVDAPGAPYQLPKDLTDLNRLDFQHFILRQALTGNYIAPIASGPVGQILDVGTGTGRWAIEMAQAFPQAQVFGIDLEESQDITGKIQTIPPNYHFQISNVLQGLPFLDNTFDFVHQRLLVTGIPFVRWSEVIRELIRVTRPGGWIEMVESGVNFINEGPATVRWSSWSSNIMSPAGIDVNRVAQLEEVARQTGLNCTCHIYNIPTGAWGGRVGAMLQQDLLSVYDSLTPRYQRLLNVSTADAALTRSSLIQEWEKLRTSLSFFVVIGQK
ncbi:MAG TPA: class I SAM-dependent methyltransferase [Ktedonobacteraceae bacterium]|nr:class I SAM-dependent methyltransferase [Ktedonobacteraceae bacterium]